ncbi:hypothetical protein KBC40_01635 [Patescibacteria group bacterium]|jgi:hypothetical protein|nr:hypothetical protein [Patescibacteria group bacterium]
MLKVQTFSQGKTAERNEDYFDYNKKNFVIADGSTDKSGRKYQGKTGGEIAAQLVVKSALSSDLNGVELIKFLNKKLANLYKKLGINKDIAQAQYRFTCACIVVRLIKEEIIITYLGNLGFRINAKNTYQEKIPIDLANAKLRAKYIKKTSDIKGSRDHIMPLLFKELEYQNHPTHHLGYGFIDGTNTPAKFIKVFKYPSDDVNLIELFTDGYFITPTGTTIDDWEKGAAKVEKEDPDKWKKYKSTKSKDDRTVAIIQLKN